MSFLVTFPASNTHLMVLRMSLKAISEDSILIREYQMIANLRITEYVVINNRYLVVRIS